MLHTQKRANTGLDPILECDFIRNNMLASVVRISGSKAQLFDCEKNHYGYLCVYLCLIIG
jgi:hypothetical protein